MIFDTLYKIDENNNVRTWKMETDDIGQYCTHSGVQGGKIVTSKWKQAKPKNVGKANATTAEQQAELEVKSKYTEQLEQGGYFRSVEKAWENPMTFFEPMLAHKWEDHKAKTQFPVWSQPKLDGIRCIITKDGMKSRNGKPILAAPHIMKSLQAIFELCPTLVFDGELYNHELRNDFEKIVSLVRKVKPEEVDIQEAANLVEYHIYDIYDLQPNWDDVGFSARNYRINSIFADYIDDTRIKHVRTTRVENQEELDALYGEYLEDGYEGQMIRTNGPYEQKRSKTLLKRKEFEDKEFPIERLEEGEGNWAGAIKRAYIRLEDDRVQKSGVKGSFKYLAEVLEEADEYTFATIRFQNRTADGFLRFPVAVALWKGKRDL
jgi:DNA ligase-1